RRQPVACLFSCEAWVVPSLLSELYPAGGKIDLELLDLFRRALDHGGAQGPGGQPLEGERGLRRHDALRAEHARVDGEQLLVDLRGLLYVAGDECVDEGPQVGRDDVADDRDETDGAH